MSIAHALIRGAFQHTPEALAAYVEKLRGVLRLDDWQAVFPHVLDGLTGRDPAAVVRVLQPILEARFGEYLSAPTEDLIAAAEGFGVLHSEAHATTLRAVLDVLRPAVPPIATQARRRARPASPEPS